MFEGVPKNLIHYKNFSNNEMNPIYINYNYYNISPILHINFSSFVYLIIKAIIFAFELNLCLNLLYINIIKAVKYQIEQISVALMNLKISTKNVNLFLNL